MIFQRIFKLGTDTGYEAFVLKYFLVVYFFKFGNPLTNLVNSVIVTTIHLNSTNLGIAIALSSKCIVMMMLNNLLLSSTWTDVSLSV